MDDTTKTPLPVAPLNRWHVRLDGPLAVAASGPLPWTRLDGDGDGALQRLLALDLEDQAVVVEFINEVSAPSLLDGLLDDMDDDMDDDSPQPTGESFTRAMHYLEYADVLTEAFPDDDDRTRAALQLTIERYLDAAHLARALAWAGMDPDQWLSRPIADIETEHRRITVDGPGTAPFGQIVWALRRHRLDLATVISHYVDDPHAVEIAWAELQALHPDPGFLTQLVPGDTFEERQIAVAYLLWPAARRADQSLSRHQPRMIDELVIRPAFHLLDDYLWVDMYNAVAGGYGPKLCANPECRTPFIWQTGQSVQGRQRRDATYCSKRCADRSAYLRRRDNA